MLVIIVALLVLIVLIMLFGRHAILRAFGRLGMIVLGFSALAALVIAIKETVGEENFGAVLIGVPIAMALLAGAALLLEGMQTRRAARVVEVGERKAAHAAMIKGTPKIERLRYHFAKDIERFDAAARATAERLYVANDVDGYRRFCRAEIERLGQPAT